MKKKTNNDREELVRKILIMTPEQLAEFIKRAKQEPLLKDTFANFK